MQKTLYIIIFLCCLTAASAQEKPVQESSVTVSTSVKPAKADSVELSAEIYKFAKDNIWIIKEVMTKYVAPVTAEALKNDMIMRETFRTSYEMLPFGIRMIMSKEEFVAFGMKHRWKIVPLIEPSKKKKK